MGEDADGGAYTVQPQGNASHEPSPEVASAPGDDEVGNPTASDNPGGSCASDAAPAAKHDVYTAEADASAARAGGTEVSEAVADVDVIDGDSDGGGEEEGEEGLNGEDDDEEEYDDDDDEEEYDEEELARVKALLAEDEAAGAGTGPSQRAAAEQVRALTPPHINDQSVLQNLAAAAGITVMDSSSEEWAKLIKAKARQITQARNAKQLPLFPEPKRNKTHWDHVLAEMEWLAKDIMKERLWKMKQSKRFAGIVSRSKLDVVSRQQAREAEEKLQLRRRAAWVAKQVGEFWKKAQSVVSYKSYVAIEARRKEVMDKHLDLIVGQTERYSKMLARGLTGGDADKGSADLPGARRRSLPPAAEQVPPPAPPAPHASPVPRLMEGAGVRLKSVKFAEDSEAAAQVDVKPEAPVVEAEPPPGVKLEAAPEAQQEAGMQDGGRRKRQRIGPWAPATSDMATLPDLESLAERDAEAEAVAAAAAAGSEAAEDEEGTPNGAETVEGGATGSAQQLSPGMRRSSSHGAKRGRGRSSGHAGHPGGEDGDAEYQADSNEDQDDESTLETEMQLAESGVGDGVHANEAAELAGLDEEADLPLEALLARYGFVMPAEGAEVPPASSEEPEEEEEEEGWAEEQEEAEGRGDQAWARTREEAAAAPNHGVATDHAAMHASDVVDKAGSTPSPVKQKATRKATEDSSTAKPAKSSSLAPPERRTTRQHAAAQPTSPRDERVRRRSDQGAAANTLQPSTRIEGAGSGASRTRSRVVEAAAATPAVGPKAVEEGLPEALAVSNTDGSDSSRSRQAPAALPVPQLPQLPDLAFAADTPSHTAVISAASKASAAVSSSPPAGSAAAPLGGGAGVEGEAVAGDAAAGAGAVGDAVTATAAIEDGDSRTDEQRMMDASRDAIAAQPTGYTLSTTQVQTKVPFLLKYSLREYQHVGLDWLVTIYKKKLNGILADEMGLGKTIQTISLLAWLACEEGTWGPHLIVVPTSVMLNWEVEFKKWCPAFKLLTYYGSAKERKVKRQGWSKPNAFHVCITSYTLVLQDAKMFRRKRWKYLILDEAHMIKNWKSLRWQTLLRFSSKRRLLITGTPLQNDLMELWSLMHFLMPTVFASHDQFRDWFCNPLTGMVEGSEVYNKTLVERLHGVLRPFLLRRMKAEVERQMPAKHEHVVTCRLSRRQRTLYEEYMASGEAQVSLRSGNFLGIINCLMQLRKVCNHPDLFEGRPIVSAYDMPQLLYRLPSSLSLLAPADSMASSAAAALDRVNLGAAGLLLTSPSMMEMASWQAQDMERLQVTYDHMAHVCGVPDWDATADDASSLMRSAAAARQAAAEGSSAAGCAAGPGPSSLAALRASYRAALSSSSAYCALAASLQLQQQQHNAWRTSRLQLQARLSANRCARHPVYGADLLAAMAALEAHRPRCLDVGRVRVTDTDLTSGPPEPQLWREVGAAPLGTAAGPAMGPAGGGAAAGSGLTTADRLIALVPSTSGCVFTAAECSSGPGRQPRRLPKALIDLILPSLVHDVTCTLAGRAASMEEVLQSFMFVVPKARAAPPSSWCGHPDASDVRSAARDAALLQRQWFASSGTLRTARVRQQLFIPDRRLIQYDCGKLQELASLLRRLKSGGHRVLIFTQMARMLDVLEAFLNLHGHTYMRLDGSTKPEQRQVLMQRFNTDTKQFVFILSTRSGGVGINLTGADTVIFYDSDWNPAMDAQAQDRCHRIGQTREVHIYRLISENTIEENILRKSDQKRQLDFLAIQSGGFNTDLLSKINVQQLFGAAMSGAAPAGLTADEVKAALRSAEDQDDAAAATVAEQEAAAELNEFTQEPPAGPADGVEEDGEDGDEERDGDAGGAAASAAAAGACKTAVKEGEGELAKASSGAMGLMSMDEVGDMAEQMAAGQHAAGANARPADVLQRLEASLRPVEKYAVRLLEELQPVDVATVATAATTGLAEEQWDVDEMQRRKEEQEAEADESDEDQRLVAGWDPSAAGEDYQAYADIVRSEVARQEAQEAAAVAAATIAGGAMVEGSEVMPRASKSGSALKRGGRGGSGSARRGWKRQAAAAAAAAVATTSTSTSGDNGNGGISSSEGEEELQSARGGKTRFGRGGLAASRARVKDELSDEECSNEGAGRRASYKRQIGMVGDSEHESSAPQPKRQHVHMAAGRLLPCAVPSTAHKGSSIYRSIPAASSRQASPVPVPQAPASAAQTYLQRYARPAADLTSERPGSWLELASPAAAAVASAALSLGGPPTASNSSAQLAQPHPSAVTAADIAAAAMMPPWCNAWDPSLCRAVARCAAAAEQHSTLAQQLVAVQQQQQRQQPGGPNPSGHSGSSASAGVPGGAPGTAAASSMGPLGGPGPHTSGSPSPAATPGTQPGPPPLPLLLSLVPWPGVAEHVAKEVGVAQPQQQRHPQVSAELCKARYVQLLKARASAAGGAAPQSSGKVLRRRLGELYRRLTSPQLTTVCAALAEAVRPQTSTGGGSLHHLSDQLLALVREVTAPRDDGTLSPPDTPQQLSVTATDAEQLASAVDAFHAARPHLASARVMPLPPHTTLGGPGRPAPGASFTGGRQVKKHPVVMLGNDGKPIAPTPARRGRPPNKPHAAAGSTPRTPAAGSNGAEGGSAVQRLPLSGLRPPGAGSFPPSANDIMEQTRKILASPGFQAAMALQQQYTQQQGVRAQGGGPPGQAGPGPAYPGIGGSAAWGTAQWPVRPPGAPLSSPGGQPCLLPQHRPPGGTPAAMQLPSGGGVYGAPPVDWLAGMQSPTGSNGISMGVGLTLPGLINITPQMLYHLSNYRPPLLPQSGLPLQGAGGGPGGGPVLPGQPQAHMPPLLPGDPRVVSLHPSASAPGTSQNAPQHKGLPLKPQQFSAALPQPWQHSSTPLQTSQQHDMTQQAQQQQQQQQQHSDVLPPPQQREASNGPSHQRQP